MDDTYRMELKKKLESGDISRELYDEIMKRWDSSDSEGKGASEDDTGNRESRGRESETRVFGSSRMSEVSSDSFDVAGSARVSGNVDVGEMSVAGSIRVEGEVKVEGDLDSSGSLVAEKSITAGNIDSSGSLRAESIRARMLDSSGVVRVKGEIESDSMDVSGSCEAEKITSKAIESSGVITAKEIRSTSIDISGGITADTVECDEFTMSLDGYTSRNRIGTLKCREISIEGGRRFRKDIIEVEEITCETAYLESVRAKKISGGEVTLGDGCEVDYVEARVIKTSGDAVIRERKIL